MKLNFGSLTDLERTKEADVIVKCLFPTKNIADILISVAAIGFGVYRIAASAFENGANSYFVEYDKALLKVGALDEPVSDAGYEKEGLFHKKKMKYNK